MAQTRVSTNDFVTKVATSDMMEIQSSQLALGRQPDADTKPFAERMVKDHKQTSNELKALVDTGKVKRSLPTGLDPEHQKKLEGLLRDHLAMAKKLPVTNAALPVPSYAQETTGPATPAQVQVLNAIPEKATTIANYYKQDVYDTSEHKIGEIVDALINPDGTVAAFIISVGGFLGIGETDVAVPFHAVSATERKGAWYLTMNATKDSLRAAPGFKYDNANATWTPAART